MIRKIVAISMGIVLAVVCRISMTQELETQTTVPHAPVQVIRPEVEILDRPVIVEVQIDPSLGEDTSMRILCATSTYRGEIRVQREDVTISLTISGEIRELSAGKIFVSFDVSAQSEDLSGGRGLAGSGAAMLESGKPKTVLTVGGSSIILTVRVPPEETEL